MTNQQTQFETLFGAVLIFVSLSVTCSLGVDSNRRICAYGKKPICCSGWYNNISSPCSIPSCAGDCGDYGQCIRPNTCLCADRRLRFSCDADEPESMQHDQPSVTCVDDCNRRGRCVDGTCECDDGFSGEACEEILESACFAKLQRGLCVNPIQYSQHSGNVTTKMSREVCCNSFGIAWGEPCHPCQTSYCGRGYAQKNGSCRDIDECQIPGVCQNGKCSNHEGMFTCKCPDGYTFNEESLQCKPTTDICASHGQQCLPGGRCVPLKSGDFKCVCKWNYRSAGDQKSCIQKKAITFDICAVYSKSICKNGVCVSRGNSYECDCNDGFEPSVDRKSCRRKIDVCALHRGYLCPNGECVSFGRDFYCNCDPGFTPSFDRRRCLNHCERMGPNICPNGRCVAMPYGDYECQCYPGYERSTDRKHCVPEATSVTYELPPIMPYVNDEAASPSNFPYAPTARYTGGNQPYQWNSWRSHRAPSYPPFPRRSWSRPNGVSNAPCNQPHIVQRCSGGTCLNLGRHSYMCECLPGFDSYDQGRYCGTK
ncbi:fibrillin-2 [Clonorchis sinensis]|uniref:Fibrillin-2 n=1 Tax=Clonorchis sinensis TaxID=79923 RepID=G7YU07_CLOSI|nr:fibrillin-2 [Clonorchis sinensis]